MVAQLQTRQSTYQLLINEREEVGIQQTKYPKSLIDFSQLIDNVYGNLEDYKLTKKRKAWIVFDDLTVGIEANKIEIL